MLSHLKALRVAVRPWGDTRRCRLVSTTGSAPSIYAVAGAVPCLTSPCRAAPAAGQPAPLHPTVTGHPQARGYFRLAHFTSRGSVAAAARQRGRRQAEEAVTEPPSSDVAAEAAEALDSAGRVEAEDGGRGDTAQASPAKGDVAASVFQHLGLDDLVTAQLGTYGISAPTPVQEKAIPSVLSGRNTAIASYTGSGKTLAYVLPAVQLAIAQAEKLLLNAKPEERARLGPTCIIVAPSRELAMQILDVARQVLPPEAKQAVQQLIGGANSARQEEALRKHQPLIVVGTPGRLAEHSRKGTLGTHRTGLLILDEADQLLAPNFREDMVRLTQHVGKKVETGRQTVIVSATLTPGVLKSAAKWCPDPDIVFLQPGMVQAETSVQKPREHSDGQPAWGWGVQAGGAFAKVGAEACWFCYSPTPSLSLSPNFRHPVFANRAVSSPSSHSEVTLLRWSVSAGWWQQRSGCWKSGQCTSNAADVATCLHHCSPTSQSGLCPPCGARTQRRARPNLYEFSAKDQGYSGQARGARNARWRTAR
mmetsp:Transcript_25122/g.65217  ORF Transcript_25122/g.65217 Transcript_25122/m.65217 type:complete len:534 (+) Transcript_25122:176-1777(+)